MTVKICKQTYLSGMPVLFEKTIDIDGVRITLKHEQFKELCDEISKSVSEDLSILISIAEKYKSTTNEVHNIIKEIREIFYKIEDESDWAFRKDVGDIRQKDLDNLLDKNKKLFGLE